MEMEFSVAIFFHGFSILFLKTKQDVKIEKFCPKSFQYHKVISSNLWPKEYNTSINLPKIIPVRASSYKYASVHGRFIPMASKLIVRRPCDKQACSPISFCQLLHRWSSSGYSNHVPDILLVVKKMIYVFDLGLESFPKTKSNPNFDDSEDVDF